MLNSIFYISLAIGILASAAVTYLYSRKGSHPRFYPNRGMVAMLFIVLFIASVFLSLFISRVVGKESPPALPKDRPRKSIEISESPAPNSQTPSEASPEKPATQEP